MTLVPTSEVLAVADHCGRAAGAFNIIQLEHAEAIAAAAEARRAPVVLQISENCVRYHGCLAPLGRGALAVAEASSAVIAVHLDHATDIDLVAEAVELGFGSVMFDAADDPYRSNVRRTAEVVALCHRSGLWVEGELGEVGGKDGDHSAAGRTDPEQARCYVGETGVDALAVAVGSSHAMTSKNATLDLDLVAALRKTVPVPLVLHGSSGVPHDQIRSAAELGIRKVNVATELNKAFTEAVRRELGRDPALVDTRRYLGAGRAAIEETVGRLLAVLGW